MASGRSTSAATRKPARYAAVYYVPRPVVDDMLDIMPAPGLVIHEYKKHGTCSGLDPQNYYRLARSLYRKIQIPQEFTNPMEPRTVSPDEVMRALSTPIRA